MNIAINTIVSRMEKELQALKQEHSLTKQKERVAAIRSLCEVILEENDNEVIVPNHQKAMQKDQDIILQKMIGQQQPINKKGNDAEANGDSIFDF
jgi:hypothetical protein